MKNLFYTFGIILLASVTAFAQKVDHRKQGASMPPFLLGKPTGGTFSNAHLKHGQPVMVMIFSPQCDHCEGVIDFLKKQSREFKNMQLVLVAEDRNKDHMKGFMDKNAITAHPLFQNIGTDKGNFIPFIYTNKILPQVNVYDKNHNLVRILDGNFPLDSIKVYIQ